MSRVERGIPQEVPEGAKEVKVVGDPSKLFLTPWFKDHAELSRASYSYVEYARVALAQAIRTIYYDRDLLRSMARRNYEKRNQYDVRRFASRMLHLLGVDTDSILPFEDG